MITIKESMPYSDVLQTEYRIFGLLVLRTYRILL